MNKVNWCGKNHLLDFWSVKCCSCCGIRKKKLATISIFWPGIEKCYWIQEYLLRYWSEQALGQHFITFIQLYTKFWTTCCDTSIYIHLRAKCYIQSQCQWTSTKPVESDFNTEVFKLPVWFDPVLGFKCFYLMAFGQI